MTGEHFTYFSALVATILIESVVAFALLPAGKRRAGLWDLMLFNAITHPLLVYVMWYTRLPPAVGEAPLIALLECAAVLVEATGLIVLTRVRAGRAFAISLAANAASFLSVFFIDPTFHKVERLLRSIYYAIT